MRALLLAALLASPCAAAKRRALVLGLDGLDWGLVRTLSEQGRLPNLSALMSEGSTATVRAEPPLSSAAIWTTVATGVSSARHGISAFVQDKRLANGSDRRAEALWESVSASSRTVAVVGWLMTWPAEPVNGWLVSDQAVNAKVGAPRAFPADFAVSPAWEPKEYAGRVKRFLPDGWDRKRQPDLRLPWTFMRDETFARIMERLLLKKPALAMVHLWGADSASHAFWPDGPAIPAYYEYLDEAVGRLRKAAGPDVLVVALSDHGFKSWAHEPGDRLAFLTGEHRAEAFFAIAGPGVRSRAALAAPRHADVAPTVLRWLGVAAPEGLEGRALEEAFEPGALPAAPAARAALVRRAEPARLPQDAMDGLRALGYVR